MLIQVANSNTEESYTDVIRNRTNFNVIMLNLNDCVHQLLDDRSFEPVLYLKHK